MNDVPLHRSFSSVRDAAARQFRLYKMSPGGLLALCFLLYYAIGIWHGRLSFLHARDPLQFPLGWLSWYSGRPPLADLEFKMKVDVLMLVANAYWLGHAFAPLVLCFVSSNRKHHFESFVFRFWLLLFVGYAILSHDRYSIAIVSIIAGLLAWRTQCWPLFWGALIGGTVGAEWQQYQVAIDGANPTLHWWSKNELRVSLVPAIVGGMLGAITAAAATILFRRWFNARVKEKQDKNAFA